MDFLTSLLTKP
jgi:hypothetical protein